MKKVLFSALIVLATVLPVRAQTSNDSKKLLDIGWHPYSYLRQNGANQHGGSISIAYMRSDRLGWVADVSIQQTGQTPTAAPIVNAAYRFGPRLYHPLKDKFTGFVEALAGGAHHGTSVTTVGTTNTVVPGRNGFAFMTGGGIDMAIKPWFSLRLAQVDYNFFHTGGTNSNGVRIHAGGVFKIGSRKDK
jgi:hypothetical protein